MSRRSLALRRPDGSSSLRPNVSGYVTFHGLSNENLSTSRTALTTAITTYEIATKVKLNALGVQSNLAASASNGLRVFVTSGNLLHIDMLTAGAANIGNVNSSATVPAALTTQPVWLRSKLTIATAVCEYWYSNDTTDVYESVATWTPIGTPQTGTNAGVAASLSNTTLMIAGALNASTSMAGSMYAFYEIVNGVKKTWFINTDIADPPSKSFVAAGGGPVWTMLGAPTFTPAQTFQGGLKGDFAFDTESTGLDQTDLFGVFDVSYTSVRVSYQPALIPQHPTLGPFREAMVVRSTAGFPATNLDGSLVMRHLATDPVLNQGFGSVLDIDLSLQQWYYYSLFVRYDDVSAWFKVAEQGWLNPGNFGNATRLWFGIPDYYRRIDSGGWLYPGVLQRLYNIIGYEFDTHRTWAATVGDVWDFEKLSAKLLPEAGAALGLPQESANGDRRLRTLVGNAMALRKQKGTQQGTEGYIAALTGYPTRAYEGLNLLLRLQHTEWPYSFSAQDGTAAPTTDNHPGWTSSYGLPSSYTLSGQLSRQVAASNEGSPVGMPDGSFYLRLTNNTGGNSQLVMQYGHGSYLPHSAIPVVPGHSYIFSTAMKAYAAATGVTVSLHWINELGVQIGAASSTALTAIGTTWVRQKTSAGTCPAGASYCSIRFYSAALLPNTTGHINIYKPILVDLAWRPIGIPSLANTVPLSSASGADVGTFVHQDYYESPREVKVNIYPNRTNLALNSDFLLNDLPPGTWASFDSPTYGQVPVAYDTYTDIIDAAPDWETSYADMASGLYPFSINAPTLAYDVVGKMHVNKAGAPFGYTLMHTFFPVTSLGGMSAALTAFTNVAPSSDDPYLTPSVSTLTTPDPGVLPPDEGILIFRVRGPMSVSEGSIASQMAGAPNDGWEVRRGYNLSGTLYPDRMAWVDSPTGSGSFYISNIPNVPPTRTDEYMAMAWDYDPVYQQRRLTVYRSYDAGQTWQQQPWLNYNTHGEPFNTAALLRIGGTTAGSGIFDGRIYWVEMRNTLSPLSGSGSVATPGYISFPGTTGNSLSTVSTAALQITGDICIVVRIDRWGNVSGATTQFITGKWDETGNKRSYALLQRNAAGKFLRLSWSANGTAVLSHDASAVVPDTSPYCAAVLDVDNGASGYSTRFWHSPDGVTWTQVGTTQTTATVTSISSQTSPLTIAEAAQSATFAPFNGDIGHVSIRNGSGAVGTVGGTEVFRIDGMQTLVPTITNGASFYAGTGQLVTVNRSAAGTASTTVIPSTAGQLWRFDAADYPGSGTTWTDPRGRTWTSGSASAITKPNAGVKMQLAFEWYTNNNVIYRINVPPDPIGAAGVPLRTISPTYTLGLTEGRYEVVNAIPPANALYGRLLVLIGGTVAHDTSFTSALIEDSPYPGTYFNGDDNNGEDGDFFYAIGKGYTGAAHLSPSVYYMRFKRFASGVAGADALTQLLPQLLPYRRSFKLISAATGLYNAIV